MQERKVKWLKAQLTSSLPTEDKTIEDRIILIGEKHENKVYFDQHGELVGKFGIKASPAVVVQDGLQLKIEEVLVND